jgi:23S rRNA G2445 N2-methylase RlmL
VLAAGLVKLSGWEKHLLLLDGMCGAGTIAIEAALWANNIPPGVLPQ